MYGRSYVNLLDNSIKYNKHGGTVTFSSHDQTGRR